VGKTHADASGAQERSLGVEGTKPLYRAVRLCFSLGAEEGAEAAATWGSVAAQDPAGVCQDRNHRRGLAYFPSHRWIDAGGDGRASTYHSGLPAAQSSQRDEPVSAGHLEHQASGAGQTSACNPASRVVIEKQIHTDPITLPSIVIAQMHGTFSVAAM